MNGGDRAFTLLRKDGARRLGSLVLFGQERAEAIELSFPGGAVVANPLLESAKAGGFDAAGSHAA